MNRPPLATAAALIVLLTGGAALAQTAAPVSRSAKAALCSREASAKRLHGDARWKFRAACEKAR